MTPSAAHYLALIRCLSAEEISQWRHAYDLATKRPSLMPGVEMAWRHRVEERSGPIGTHGADATIEGE